LDANFYLQENFNGTVSFRSVTCPREFVTIADGHWLWKDFSLFSVVSGCHYLRHVNVDYCICV